MVIFDNFIPLSGPSEKASSKTVKSPESKVVIAIPVTTSDIEKSDKNFILNFKSQEPIGNVKSYTIMASSLTLFMLYAILLSSSLLRKLINSLLT